MSVNIHLKAGVKATTEGPVSADTKCPTIADFEGVYQEIKKFLLDDARKKMECDENRIRYLGKMMDTTVLGGKYNRGMTVVEIGHQLAIANGASKARYAEIVHQCSVCGWIIEFLQAHFLVEDDIMDSSKTRRGKPCWYLHPGVTTQCAINDGMILLGWCTVMAQHFFAGKTFQREVLDLLHDADYRTLFGQFYDVTGMVDSAKLDPDVKVETTDDFTEFTLPNYKRIVKYKTAYYTYFAPLSLGKAVCHDLVDSARLDAEPFSLLVGEYFQIQDDFLDCFGDPAVIQKIGTDIEDKKLSWLATTFLAHASEADKKTFMSNYGRHEPEKVKIIKQLYRDAKLEAKFEEYEKGCVSSVEVELAKLKGVSNAFGNAAESLWRRTYKRIK